MKTAIHIELLLVIFLLACGQEATQQQNISLNSNSIDSVKPVHNIIINLNGLTLQTRILPPSGYQRMTTGETSFAEYLRQLPLKPHNSEVLLFNGKAKPNCEIYDAVVDLNIGNKDLHQCADAVMRLRAEYLWNQKQYEKIHFNFTNGFRVDYTEWMKGKRIIVKGNSSFWTESNNPSNTYEDFWEYMEIIFNYAGTLSLSKELKEVNIDSLKIGDIFIQGGSPGHAIIIVDIAFNSKKNKKVMLLAQSYMPAQEIQILKNPNEALISPWYSANFGQKLITPQWDFNKSDLKRFVE